MDRGAWWAVVHGVARSRAWLSDFTFTFHFHALEKEMATHSSVLAWRIPGTAEPGGLPSMGSHRVGHDWSNVAAAAAARAVGSKPRGETLVWSKVNSKNSLKIKQDFRHGEKGVLVRGREEVLRINSDILKNWKKTTFDGRNQWVSAFYLGHTGFKALQCFCI